jgi:divalent metal cation (Fe/Co/Zn/Cd) transporter
MDHKNIDPPALYRAVKLVALLNLGYFTVEFGVARAIGSVSLFADSIDFLEDATVNGLILIALGWSAWRRSIVGMILSSSPLASRPHGRHGRNSIYLSLLLHCR